MSDTPPNIGVIIPSLKGRQVAYSIFGGASLIVGGVAAYFIGTGHAEPQYVVGAQSVIAYLAIPFTGLALANAQTKKPTPPVDNVETS